MIIRVTRYKCHSAWHSIKKILFLQSKSNICLQLGFVLGPFFLLYILHGNQLVVARKIPDLSVCIHLMALKNVMICVLYGTNCFTASIALMLLLLLLPHWDQTHPPPLLLQPPARTACSLLVINGTCTCVRLLTTAREIPEKWEQRGWRILLCRERWSFNRMSGQQGEDGEYPAKKNTPIIHVSQEVNWLLVLVYI